VAKRNAGSLLDGFALPHLRAAACCIACQRGARCAPLTQHKALSDVIVKVRRFVRIFAHFPHRLSHIFCLTVPIILSVLFPARMSALSFSFLIHLWFSFLSAGSLFFWVWFLRRFGFPSHVLRFIFVRFHASFVSLPLVLGFFRVSPSVVFSHARILLHYSHLSLSRRSAGFLYTSHVVSRITFIWILCFWFITVSSSRFIFAHIFLVLLVMVSRSTSYQWFIACATQLFY